MGAYNELDQVIQDYVGFIEPDNVECADTVLYDNITAECSMHVKGQMSLDKMSKDASYCITEWEKLMQDAPQQDLNFGKEL